MRTNLPGKLLCTFSLAGLVSACGYEPVLKGFQKSEDIKNSVFSDFLKSPEVESHCRNMIQDVFLAGGLRYQFEKSRTYAIVSMEGVTVVSPENTTCRIAPLPENRDAISITCALAAP